MRHNNRGRDEGKRRLEEEKHFKRQPKNKTEKIKL
jgi:hypothetical protein